MGKRSGKQCETMSYRPITDFWFLARCKYKNGRKRYGGYLGGFPERARVLIGASLSSPVLHVCGGLAKDYPYERGFGKYDNTIDLDETCSPDFVQDVRRPLPKFSIDRRTWVGMICDPPYSESDAEKYSPGRNKYPNPHALIQNAIDSVPIGIRVGIIHYVLPKCPKNAKFVACVGVCCGFANRIRCYSVFERIA